MGRHDNAVHSRVTHLARQSPVRVDDTSAGRLNSLHRRGEHHEDGRPGRIHNRRTPLEVAPIDPGERQIENGRSCRKRATEIEAPLRVPFEG